MVSKYETGMRGQREAEDFLTKKGHIVLKRNYRTRTGEIDIITSEGDYIVFVEVKYRAHIKYGLPREAVGAAKQHRIIRTALHFISFNMNEEKDFRFDVVEVYPAGGKTLVNHIENAFGV